jgi:L-ascorbate metabolism protein UlaG (beta-lactamase superfamily)
MVIQYHGDACIRLTGKTSAGEFTVLLDPYDAKTTGLKAIRPSAVDLVCSTSGRLPEFEAGPYRVIGPGEYEARGVEVVGIPVGATTVYRIVAEGIAIAHLGNLAQPLVAEVVDRLGDIDVCIVPVGGHGTLTAKQAAEVIEQVEPRLVVPIQYAVDGAQLPYDGVAAFAKEMGAAATTPEEKLRVTDKELPTEEMWVKVLAVV